MKKLTLFLTMLVAVLHWQAPKAQAQGCAAPTNVAISSITSSSATVSFVPSASAVSYTVRFFSIDSTAAGITSVNTTTSPVTLTGLVAGRYHWVSVTSNCAGGTTTSSPWRSFQTSGSGGPGPTACAPPTGVAVSAISSTSAVVTFASLSGGLSYRAVYYAVGDSIHAITQTLTSSPLLLSGLLPNTSYVVRIYTNCSGLTSAPAQVVFRTLAAPTVCGAVTNVVVTGTSATTASVSFTPGAGNTRFHITYHLLNDSAHWVNTTASPATITGLIPGQTYYIQVTSLCGSGASTTYTSGGQMTYSFRGVLAARNVLVKGEMSVYPNPAHHLVGIVLPALPGAAPAQLTLLNVLGQAVLTKAVPLSGTETNAQLDLSGIKSGMYMLRAETGNQVATQRLEIK